jgi:cyclophilin family peptidyl-prolyl cis-trans isomerase
MMKKTFLATLLVFFLASSATAAEQARIIMETSMGKMTLVLFDDKAPATCKNFRTYVRDGFFDGLIFHRVIPGFMIQGGGFAPGLKKKITRDPIINEAHNGLKNRRGTLAMARTQDINSATAQFFINVNDNRSLDHRSMRMDEYGYAVFGEVVDGMEVADAIVAVPRGQQGMYGDVPNKDVVILKMYEETK